MRRVLPDHAGIRIVDGHVAVGFDDRLDPLVRGIGFFGILAVDGQLLADVAALRRIDAPQNANPFAVLGILPRAEIDLVVIDDGRADDVVPRAAAAQLAAPTPSD